MNRFLSLWATLVLMLSGGAASSLYAQSGYSVKGVVVDAIGPIAGAAVLEQGTTNGTATDLDGNFTLAVKSADAIVEISCIGYTTLYFKASELPANILMQEDTQFLDEVVVIGYGTVKKGDLTGSVSTVKADDINKGSITSPADLLRGKSAGVVVTSGDGMPGSGATIRIRGGSSLSASNEPLIVIDGLPISNDGISGMSSPLTSINPEDIESFTVLKDASATAIYGSRASNGVIVITTKKGAKGSSTIPHITADFTSSVATIAKYADVLDATQLRDLIKEVYGADSDAYMALGSDESINTDWQKEIYQVAPTYDGNLSVSGNTSIAQVTLPYRVSGGYTSQEGTLKGSKMNRGTASVNLAPKFFDNHLTVNLNGKGTYSKNWYANQSAIGAANHYVPTKPVKDPNGLNGYSTWYDLAGNINTMATMNPVALLESKTDMADAYRFIGNAQFDYKVHGLEDLRLNLNLGMDWASSNGVTEIAQGSEESYHSTTQSGGGSHTDYEYSRMDRTLEFYGDYNHTFADKHFLDVMAGYSWQNFYNSSDSKSYRISDNKDLGGTPSKGEYYLISFFGRINYTFADKYLLTATIRRDGTSRFQNHKWGLFPSVALGWNVKKEKFLADVEPISTTKIRLSWGETGQQAVGGYYDTFAKFYNNLLGSYYQFGGNLVTPITALGYSADLKWETTDTYNAGVDLGFFDDRLTLAVDAYLRKTKDLLSYIPVPVLSNLTNYLNTNIASLENRGYEIDLNGIILNSRDLSWTAGVNMAYNKNVITKLNSSSDNKAGVETGGISGGTGNNVQMHQVGYPMNSFYVYQQVYDVDGKPLDGAFVDRNGDGVINSDDKYFFHKPQADYTFGFNTQFSYKNWTAALSGHSSIGNYVYNNVASDTEMLGDLWTNSFVSNRVTSALNSRFTQARYLSDYYIHDASFLKLDNLTISYTFPKLFNAANRDASLNLFGTVQNICTITKYEGIDPEVYGGIDGTVYPRPRTFILGLKFNF